MLALRGLHLHDQPLAHVVEDDLDRVHAFGCATSGRAAVACNSGQLVAQVWVQTLHEPRDNRASLLLMREARSRVAGHDELHPTADHLPVAVGASPCVASLEGHGLAGQRRADRSAMKWTPRGHVAVTSWRSRGAGVASAVVASHRLAAYRAKRDYSLNEVAWKLRELSRAVDAIDAGPTVKTVWRWEQGSTPTPRYRRLLCQLYDATAAELGFQATQSISDGQHEVALPSKSPYDSPRGHLLAAITTMLDNTPAGSRMPVLAATTLSRALWSAGQVKEALRALDACEREQHTVLASDPEARVAVDHAAALALHDLERNLRVVDHARRAVEAYRAAGRIEAQLIMGVNLGDGLWGAGRVTDARTVLEDVWMQAEAAGLPYAQDIAAMCLANVLAATGDHSRALELYDAGIELADRIGHDWDAIYGRVHQALGVAEADRYAGSQELLHLNDRARDAGYDYLRSLAVAYSPLVAYAAGDTEAARWALGQASIRHDEDELAYGPAAHLRGLEVLLAQAPSRGQAIRFVRALGRCEGLKGRPPLVVQAIQRLRALNLLDLVQAEFVTRWAARFAPEVLEPRIGEELRLRTCDPRACEARCCYDGVYLKDGEPERIRSAVASDPEFFAHLPESFIVHGEWAGEPGVKTAVRPHTFHSPDFPEHFNQTRCVFAFADGACSLQAFAASQGDDPWKYKPRGCWMYPFRTVDGTPPRRDQRLSATGTSLDSATRAIWRTRLAGRSAATAGPGIKRSRPRSGEQLTIPE